MTDDEFLAAFEAQAISRDDWTHEAHVRTGWLYCTRTHEFDEASKAVSSGIRALNKANAVPVRLYHETVTIAFMRLIWARTRTGVSTWPAFRDAYPELLNRDKPILQDHYSKDCLESDDARLQFVNPDRQELPPIVAG